MLIFLNKQTLTTLSHYFSVMVFYSLFLSNLLKTLLKITNLSKLLICLFISAAISLTGLLFNLMISSTKITVGDSLYQTIISNIFLIFLFQDISTTHMTFRNIANINRPSFIGELSIV